MAKTTTPLQRAECELGEALSAVRGIVLQVAEFALFMYGLVSLVLHLMGR
jgi:hypothetical protein